MSEYRVERLRDRIWVLLLTTDEPITYRDLAAGSGASVQTCRSVAHTAKNEGLVKVVKRDPEVYVEPKRPGVVA